MDHESAQHEEQRHADIGERDERRVVGVNTGILLEQENVKVAMRKQNGAGGDETQPVERGDMRVYRVDRRVAAGLHRIHELSAACRRSRQRNFMRMPAAAADYSGAIVDPQPSGPFASSGSSN